MNLYNVMRGISAVECRTRNRESLVRICFETVSKFGHRRSLQDGTVHPAVGPINENLAIDGGGNVSEYSSCVMRNRARFTTSRQHLTHQSIATFNNEVTVHIYA